MASQKISSFTGQTLLDNADQFTFVRSGTNFKVAFSDLKNDLGVTGTLNQVGDPLAAPVLEQTGGGVNNIRNLENGAGMSFNVSAQNGVVGNWNVAQDSAGVSLTSGLNNLQPVISSLVEGAGIQIDKTGDEVTITALAGTGGLNQEQILYVAKAGNDSSTGLNINSPKLTISSAILDAITLTPSESNQITIKVIDAGDYTENPSLPEWVHLDANFAALNGRLTLSDNTITSLRRLENTSVGAIVARKISGLGFAKLTVELLIVADPLQIGIQLNSGNLHADIGVMSVDGGYGVQCKNDGRMSFIISEIQLFNGGTAFRTSIAGGGPACFLSGNVLYAKDDGTGIFIDSAINGDVINIQAGSILVNTLYDMSAGTTLSMFATEVSGTEIADPTAIIKATIAGGGINGVTVTVLSAANLPVPIANVITLKDNTVYIIAAHIDIGANTISYGVASEIQGINTSISSISSTSTSPIIECTNQLLRLSLVILSNPNGDLFDFTGSSSAAFLIDQVGAFSFLNIGTFNDTDVGVMNECLFSGFANGITFTGTGVGSWSISSCIFTGFSGVAIDFGTASIGTASLDSNVFSGLGGSTSWSGLPNSGNITVRASADKNIFNGAGTALVGIAPSDIKYRFIGNTNVADSRNAADVFLIGGSETITTGSAGDWQEIGVPSAGGVSWSSDIAERFTVGTDGVITYIGEVDIEVRMSGRATVEKATGGSDVIEVRFAVNWDGTASDSGLEKSRAQTQSADPTTVPIGALIALTQNDNVRPIFSNVTGASNIVASVSAIEVID